MAIALPGAALPAPFAWGGHVAGQVIFIVGEASAVPVAQENGARPLAYGSQVHEGERLETGSSSHVHLRMVDGGFISLRSDSALTLHRYRYFPEVPERSETRVTLHHGVVRSVSGEIGARSRERFRLETPVAAIGIRGTDFSVMTQPDTSRLSLRRGGVTMAPLSDACRAGGMGPCEVSGAAELFDSMPGALLEARLGETRATVTFGGITPDEYRPPHPHEDSLAPGLTASSTSPFKPARGESAPGAESLEEAMQNAERYLARPGLITDAYARGQAAPEIQPRDRGLTASPQVTWGRWNHLNEPGSAVTVARLLHANGRYAGINSTFALVEQRGEQRRLPSQGRAHFNLNRYEAYIKRGDTLEPAAISHPGLVVDFEQQRFAAHMNVHAPSLPDAVPVMGGGRLRDGYLESDSGSPALMTGVLADRAAEAGLLFDLQLGQGVNAVGATHWMLDRE